MFADLNRQTRAIGRASGGSPGARSRYFLRKAFEERSADPRQWATLLLRKSWDWLRPYPSPLFWPPGVVWTIGIFTAALTLLAVVGLAGSPRPGVRLFALALLFLTMAAHVAIIVVWRYRVPYWDPVLLLYGVWGAARPTGTVAPSA